NHRLNRKKIYKQPALKQANAAMAGQSGKSILCKALFTMPSFLRRQESNGKFRLLKINPNN
ncbi:hypothetical protein, partial [Kingella kingae]|uniref:hypothetical protein n=1 Tax=Kingella kingae TaxID=504 RepID=UPI001E524CBF